MANLDKQLDRLLEHRKTKGRFRSLKEYNLSSASASLVDFSSNDYLSLTTCPSLQESYIRQLSETPSRLGSTGSRLLSGGTPAHTALEQRFAGFFDSPAALLFNSGWDANVSFFSTVPQPGDWVVYDELVHASVHSGLRSSRVPNARRVAFKHNDAESLRSILDKIMREPSSSKDAGGTVFLAIESLYSMDGDLACLPAFLDVLDDMVPRERQCVVMDEAHSTGVYGDQGRGIGHAMGDEAMYGAKHRNRIGVRLMTFGKAVGSSGAVLLCSPTIRSFLINFARPLIFSTALPHSTLISLSCAWDLLESSEGDQRRLDLMGLSQTFHVLLQPLLSTTPPGILSLPPPSPIPFPRSSSKSLASNPLSPIIGLLSPNPHALSAFLLDKGYIVRPVVPPTVPPGGERVRVCLRAEMDKAVVEGLTSALREWVDLQSGRSAAGSRGRVGTPEMEVSLRAKL